MSICLSNSKLPIADQIAKTSVEAYDKLAKTGKPNYREWTVLSCILQYDNTNKIMEAVAIGTGSKCLGASEMCPRGTLLNDSHAEVIARRSFLLYLYNHLQRTAKGEKTIFTLKDDKFKLDDNIEYYFYCSELPCGDGSIVLSPDGMLVESQNSESGNRDIQSDELYGEVLNNRKRGTDDDICDIEYKRIKMDNNQLNRTGAKRITIGEGIRYEEHQETGHVRIKPGRGIPTLSLSCSDKIAKWAQVGIQGALLDMFLHAPIYLKKLVFSGAPPNSEESLKRAFFKRNLQSGADVKPECEPEILQSSIIFHDSKSNPSKKLTPASISWAKIGEEQCQEVSNKGRRQGVVVKNDPRIRWALSISKYNLYKRCITLMLSLKPEVLKKVLADEPVEDIKDIPYNEMKRKSKRYVEKWEKVKNDFFGMWTTKPDLWDFRVEFIPAVLKKRKKQNSLCLD